MFGTLRLLLAAAVAISHFGLSDHGLNPGVPAVVVFYLISGYVMRALLARFGIVPGASLAPTGAFYRDRLLRLAPQYLFYLALGAGLWVLGAQSPFLSRSPSAADWLANLLVVPLNFYMFTAQQAFTLIPPAWSLGCEIQFYLLAPLLWAAPARVRAALFALSLGIYLLALAGVLNTDWYGYRLLPGVLWMFLLGGYLHDLPRRPSALLRLLAAIWVGHLLLLLALNHWPSLQVPFRREVALGLVAGLPALLLLAPRRPRPWDSALGDLSYGLFLAHFAVLWAWPLITTARPSLPCYLLAALILATISHRYAERPMLAWRRRLRTRSRATKEFAIQTQSQRK